MEINMIFGFYNFASLFSKSLLMHDMLVYIIHCTGGILLQMLCFLCSKQVCTLAHILGACRVVLEQGRFTFHHDAVLWVLVSSIKILLTSYQVSKTKFSYIKFVKAGFRLPISSKATTADCYILHQTGYFCLMVSVH